MAVAGREEQRSSVRILALDGGGVRGLSSLLILRELMTRVALRTNKATVRPCECFELIVGTGTGGISALFLGRMKMSVDEAINEYLYLAENAFKPKSLSRPEPYRISRILHRRPSQTAVLDGSVLQKTMEEIVERITGDRNAKFADLPSEDTRQCRTAVLAANHHIANAPPFIFQSYADDRPASPYTICEVARASSSTSGLFEPFSLGNPPLVFTDAGPTGYTNPSEVALDRLCSESWNVDLIVSLGTGRREITRLDSKRSKKIARACQELIQDCEIVHDRLQRRMRPKKSYFRFNVDRGLEDVDLMEWHEAARDKLSGITDAYMRGNNVVDQLKYCVEATSRDNTHKGIRNRQVSSRERVSKGEHSDTMKSQLALDSASAQIKDSGDTMKQKERVLMRKFMPTNNPRPEIFHGRRDEVDKAVSSIQKNSCTRIAILGTGGIGKTSIALTLFNDTSVGQKFKSHRRFLTCEGLKSPAHLVDTLCTAFGIEDACNQTLDDLISFLKDEYSSHPLLVVLDNFETVWDIESNAQRETHKVLRSLGSLPSLSLILTMRGDSQPQGIFWDPVVRVKILDLDAARSTFLEVRQRDHFDDECLDELLKDVDYVPLAVTLMARLGQLESPAALLERWRKEHTRLLSRPQDNHQSMNVDVSIKISIQSHRMASNPEAIRLLSMISFLPAGVPRGDLISICRQMSNSHEASVTLREVGLAYYDATDSLRVLSPIRKYILQNHKIPEELLQDVRSFYFTMTRKALHFPSGSQPNSGNGTVTSMELNRNALNIEAVVTEALQLELDTGKKQHWQSVEAAINWTRFILTTSPRTTMIELALEVARARTARGEIFHSDPSRPVGFIQNGPFEAEPTTMTSKRGTGVIQEGIMDLNTLADGVLGRRGDGITGFLAIRFASRTENTLLDQEMTRNINPCALVPWERPKHFFFHELGDCLFSLGDVKRITGDFSAAKDLFLEALNNYRFIKSDLEVAKCLWSLGDIYIGTSELELAQKTLKQAATAFENLDLKSWLAWCDLALGRIRYMRGDIDAAEETFIKAHDAFKLENDPLGYGECLWSLGDIYLHRSEYGLARQHLEDALALFKSVDHRLWVADCFLHLGTTQRLMLDYDAAYESITEAREIWEGLKDTRGVAFAQFSMAKLQRAMGKPDAGKKTLKQAIKSFQALNDKAVVVECYMDLADAHLATMQFTAAYDAITTASHISRTADDGVWLARCALTRGRIERTEHRLDRARGSFIEAHGEFQKKGAAMEVAECLWNLGDIYLMKSEYTISHKYLEEALKVFESIKNIPWIAECLVSLGNALRLMGMHEIARETLSRARRESETIGDRRGTSRALYALVHCARVAGDYTHARDVLLDAKDALEAINDPRGVARCLWELADIYIKAYDYDAAREALEKSTAAFNNLKNGFWLMRCRLTSGRIQLLKSELDAAQETFLEAQHDIMFGFSRNYDSSESMDSETDARGMGECLFNLGEIHLQKSEGEAASYALTRALETFTSYGNLGCMADCHFSLGHAQRMMGRFDAARDHFIKGRETFKAVHNIDGAERCTAALDSILQPDGNKATKQESAHENKYPTDTKWFPGYRSVQKIIDYFLPGQEYLW